MRKPFVYIVSCLLFGLLCLAGLACGGGTETGNPNLAPGSQADDMYAGSEPIESNPAYQLLDLVCTNLEGCLSVVKVDCVEILLNRGEVPLSFDLETEAFADYWEIILAVQVNGLVIDEEALEQCRAEIDALDCDAYDQVSMETDAVQNLEEIFPEGSCSHIFLEP